MARVAPAAVEQYTAHFGADAPVRVQIYAHRPELASAYLAFGRALRVERILPDRLIELVRLRIAFHNQCRSCMAVRYEEATADGVTESLVCELEQPEEAPDLTDAEKAALHYADLMATNHLAVSDATFARLREHFDEAEIVELGFNVAFFVGYGRMAATLNVVDDLPARFLAEGSITPWGDGTLVRVGQP